MGAMKNMEQDVKLEVQGLNVDYAIYCGTLHAEHNEVALKECHPRIYLETYMEMYTQPSYEACKWFLNQFMTYDQVEEWLGTIVWDEEEETPEEPVTFSEDELLGMIRAIQTMRDIDKDTYDDTKEVLSEEEIRGYEGMRDDLTRALHKVQKLYGRQAK